MTKPISLKILLIFFVALALAFVPKAASARRGSGSRGGAGSHGSGGSHGGNSHGGGGFHSGSHSSFRGGGQSFRGSRGGAPMSSARMGGERMNAGRINRGSYGKSGGFSSSMSGNFARSSTFGRGNFGSPANSRNFGYSRGSQPAAQGSRGAIGGWQSFGNSAFRSTRGLARTSGDPLDGGHSFGNLNGGGRAEISGSYESNVRRSGQWQSPGNSAFRSTPGLARTSGNAMGGGWHSFGNSNGGGRVGLSRGYRNDVRPQGQWNSFGNSRNGSFGGNASGYSFAAASRANASDTRAFRGGFNSQRFSNAPASSRFSSFSSFSDNRSFASFGSSRRFGTADFAGSGFGNLGLGGSDFSNSFLGSGVSLFPNLLFGGLLHLGTSVLGGGGILEGGLLAASAISSVARWLGSGFGSNGYGQGDSPGVGFGYSPGGFGIGFGFAPAPVWPACNAVASFQGPGWGWSGYCAPSPYYPSGWNGISQYGDRRTNYNMAGGHFGNSDFHSEQN